MTALIGYFSRQLERTTHGETGLRRLRVLMFLLVFIAGAGVVLMIQRYPQASSLAYNSRDVAYIMPIENEVCLGGTLQYPLVTTIEASDIPGRVTIDEAWCVTGSDGACKTVPAPNPELPLMEVRNIVANPATRAVPSTLKPGVYHFWHAATNGKGITRGYIVAPITVKDCEVKP